MKRIILSVAFFVAAAHGESMYISDKLVVNVLAEANPDAEKVTTLDSGDAVEVLEKADAYSRVKLADEREGWVKSSYIVAQPPAIVRVKELEKELRAAQSSTTNADEIKQLKTQNAALQSDNDALKKAVESAQAAAKSAAETTAEAAATGDKTPGQLEGEQTPTEVAAPPLATRVWWGIALVIVGLAIGFALGYQNLARRIRRKYGSVKIY